MFTEHTIESAPPAARRAMTATANHLGYLPAATARWASSPQLLDGFQKLSGLFDTTTLDPVAREVVIMTIATRNGCHLCVAMHTARLTALRADACLIAALRGDQRLGDPRLDASRSSRCGRSTPRATSASGPCAPSLATVTPSATRSRSSSASARMSCRRSPTGSPAPRSTTSSAPSPKGRHRTEART